MGLLDRLRENRVLGYNYEVRVLGVELGEVHEKPPYLIDPVHVGSYGEHDVEYIRPVQMPGYAYFDVKISTEVTPLKIPSLRFEVGKTYQSKGVSPDSTSVGKEKSRLEGEIEAINSLIKEEGIVLTLRMWAGLPQIIGETNIGVYVAEEIWRDLDECVQPKTVCIGKNEYIKNLSENLPFDLYGMIVNYATEQEALEPIFPPHG